MENPLKHLVDRHLNPSLYTIWEDSSEGLFTFPLWNLSGQLVGYQQYRPYGTKDKKNHPREGRYYTYVSGKKDSRKIAVWGLESFNFRDDILVICEGIFDACRLHSYGIPCVAVLSSSDKGIGQWLASLGRKIYKVEDASGSKLGPWGVLKCPENDLGDCSEEQIEIILEGLCQSIQNT